jgi:hypothetical protein
MIKQLGTLDHYDAKQQPIVCQGQIELNVQASLSIDTL